MAIFCPSNAAFPAAVTQLLSFECVTAVFLGAPVLQLPFRCMTAVLLGRPVLQQAFCWPDCRLAALPACNKPRLPFITRSITKHLTSPHTQA